MPRISRLRGIDTLRRRPGHKPPRSITLIVCEGETEQGYFEAVRVRYGLSRAEVLIADNTEGAAPISVVSCAEKKAHEAGGYDHIYCVFDRDGHESFERARQRIRMLASRKKQPLPIAEAISTPCFELWVLLHFERSDAPFVRCAAVIQRVRERHLPGYEKADARIGPQLMLRLDEALANAEWLEARVLSTDGNPYTSVHRVVRHLGAVAQEGRE